MIYFQKSHLEHDTQAFEKKKQGLKIKIENLEGLKFEENFYRD
jgi:hypothetical protein